jgi:long-chain acyl-CoA synthetase
VNLANLLIRSGRGRRDGPAVALGAAVLWRYGELAERAARLAGALREGFGLEPGARVALVMKNCPEFLELVYACWHAGLAAVPVNAKLHPLELRHILGHSGARLCFATPDLAAAIGNQAADLERLTEVIDVHTPAYRRLLREEPVDLVPRGPDDLAWLFYTSGTTGRPKGAMLSHRNLMAMTLCYFADVDRIAPGDCILHAAPLSHGSGLYGLPHLAAGVCQVIPEGGGFDPAEIFALLPAHPGLMMFAAPTMVKRLVDHRAAGAADTANLKTIVYGGGPMYLEDLKRGQEHFGPVFAQIYGQGESPMTITALDKADHADTGHPRHAARLASAGRAQTAVEVRLADAADRSLPPGAPGEVLVRGDTVIPGYWDDPEATAVALRGGWLHTGDIGVFDEDGYLTLKDRSKDLIISGGANIYPREVEEALQAHAGVMECAVVGRPHAEWGEEVVAFVVARPDAEIEAEALDAHCLLRIARFKRPKAYRFVEALPKNNYGKVLKTELRARAVDEEEDGGPRS